MINSSPQPTARFGSRLFSNGNKLFHLLVKIGLPLQGGKSVLCPVGTRLLRQKPDAKIVFKHLFRCLPILFVKSEEEKRQRRGNQKNQGNIVAQAISGQEIGGDCHQRSQCKKDKLPLGQAKHDLAFDLSQILCDVHMGQSTHLL